MARRKRKNETNGRKKKILAVLLILLAVMLLTSLVTHSRWDDEMIASRDNPFTIEYRNQVGMVGAYTCHILFSLFGWVSIFLPFFLVLLALRYLGAGWRSKVAPALWFAFSTSVLVTMIYDVHKINGLEAISGAADGNLFFYLTKFLVKIIGKAGSVLLMGALIIAGLVVVGYAYPELRSRLGLPLRLDFGHAAGALGRGLKKLPGFFVSLFTRRLGRRHGEPEYEQAFETSETGATEIEGAREVEVGAAEDSFDEGDGQKRRKRSSKKLKLKTPTVEVGRETKDFVFPGLDLLDENPQSGPAVNPDELAYTARALKDTLETFGVSIDGQIEKFPGPVITRFEFKPAAGVKVHQILNLSDDLALALQAKRVRIIAPIPGKAAVGVEIPNRKAQLVYAREIIGSEAYADKRWRLPLALGKTISGRSFVTDLSRMPHLLIAGATGSGKSVCINCLITSLMFRLHPRELKFIFIDPKMLELSVYAGIPHLGRPVVTNAKRAEKVLADAVGEMENRYRKLAAEAVRNMDDYNARQKDPENRMPYIIIIVDELADMMMAAASSRIEMLVTRLAQMARAVGIHLILATQRPSVDVITGLIKANFSARIAFQVATKIDSRTILDGNGAEKLLGRGDMLFLQPGQPEAIRLHGAHISSEETRKIVKFILDQFPTEAAPGVEEKNGDDDEKGEVDLNDPLFIEAVQTVIRHKQGSVSLLQRKLGIGYQRAARLIDNLESAGVVSTYDGSKAREVLVDSSFLEKLMASRSLSDLNS
ncbi:MAG: DNA translocase FtsK 4TM domain-containing protein [Candidatus Zixiibacteriota bacterium]|nr:MAG: DNA translocase FtsK 4TM domain-containing protein [candidate division Zixibacteria bacterium]